MSQILSYERLAVSTTVIGLAAIPTLTGFNTSQVIRGLIRCETAAVRWRADGTNPTSSSGMYLEPGDILKYDGDISRLKFVRRDSVNAFINCVYFVDQ